jgi:hypothetical protein
MKTSTQSILSVLSIILALTGFSLPAHAAFTETLPQGMLLLDESFVVSWLGERWNNDGKRDELLDGIDRYDPGGGLQGIIKPEPDATYMMLVNRVNIGILDNLTFALAVPVVLYTRVSPNLNWESGDYQSQIGRVYSDADFWEWAQSMGQSKPQTWIGNRGKISDLVLGLRFRWTDYIESLNEVGFKSAVSVLGVIPTGSNADPEEVVSAGTSMWDLNFQGDLAFHLSFDKTFERELDGRLIIGLDVFYEVFFERELTSPTGAKHPLLRNFAPYIGDTYTVKPGDFSGVSLDIDIIAYKGPVLDTWLTRGKKNKADSTAEGGVESAESDEVVEAEPERDMSEFEKRFPPIITFGLNYNFVHVQQTDYNSDFPQWDFDQEDLWRPGYKNALTGKVTFSFIRLGAPFNLYVSYRTLRLIPGKNSRAPDILTVGLQIPIPLIGW